MGGGGEVLVEGEEHVCWPGDLYEGTVPSTCKAPVLEGRGGDTF